MLVNSGAMDTLVLVVVEETSAYSSCYVKTKKHWYIAHMQQHFYVIALFFDVIVCLQANKNHTESFFVKFWIV